VRIASDLLNNTMRSPSAFCSSN